MRLILNDHTPEAHGGSTWRHTRPHTGTYQGPPAQEGTVAMTGDRDPRNDLGAWLGEELRRARAAAGYTSQDHLARELGIRPHGDRESGNGDAAAVRGRGGEDRGDVPRSDQWSVCPPVRDRTEVERPGAGMVRRLGRSREGCHHHQVVGAVAGSRFTPDRDTKQHGNGPVHRYTADECAPYHPSIARTDGRYAWVRPRRLRRLTSLPAG
jgi:hypothetical protein